MRSPICSRVLAAPERSGPIQFLFPRRFSLMPSVAAPVENGFTSVAELLRRRAAALGSRTAFSFLSETSTTDSDATWTYAELDRRAQLVAAAVRRHADPGDRAVLAFPPGLDFLAAFFGCLYAGVLPSPSTFPKPRRPSPRLDAIVADCEPKLALTNSATLANLTLGEQSPAVRDLRWLAVDENEGTAAGVEPEPRSLEDAAFLQYTSGSTSAPRGVVVTHGNLLHNLELIHAGFGLPAASADHTLSGVCWLPAYHDMGLIGGILSSIYTGGTTRLMAPAAFLQQPLSWLETISRTGAEVSGGPNFAYELCVQKSTAPERAALDLSKWRVAFCGAEPIDAGVLDRFADAFAPAGFRRESFYPCYGLAEATLMASGSDGPQAPRVFHASRQKLAAHRLEASPANGVDAQALVSSGRPLGDQELLVVDPQSREPCGTGEIGEIWIRGRSVAASYWNKPDATAETFGGRTAQGEGPFLRTGDLGGIADGELYITGRLKDLIIIRGRNLYPQDVERTAQRAAAAVDAGAAFSLERNGREDLAVVHQVARDRRRDDMAPVLRAVRAAIVAEHEVDPSIIVLLRPGSLPLTSSGKVQRSRCRELLEAGELDALAEWRRPATVDPVRFEAGEASIHGEESHAGPPQPKFLERVGTATQAELALDIQRWMLGWLSERTVEDAGELSPQATFAELGLDSLTAVELNVELELLLGLRLSPSAAMSHPTPAALSAYLAEALSGGPAAREVELAPSRRK